MLYVWGVLIEYDRLSQLEFGDINWILPSEKMRW